MSKSLGNFFTIKEVLAQYHPEVLRLFILQSHYKSVIDFSDAALREARSGMERFYGTLATIEETLARNTAYKDISEKDIFGIHEEYLKKISLLPERFVEAMDDDFNTARAIGYIFDTVRILNSYMADKTFLPEAEPLFVLNAAKGYLREVGKVLGLFLDDPAAYFERDRDRETGKRALDREEIEQLIERRSEARRMKDWKKADRLRDELKEKGIVLKDSPDGTTWTVE